LQLQQVLQDFTFLLEHQELEELSTDNLLWLKHFQEADPQLRALKTKLQQDLTEPRAPEDKFVQEHMDYIFPEDTILWHWCKYPLEENQVAPFTGKFYSKLP